MKESGNYRISSLRHSPFVTKSFTVHKLPCLSPTETKLQQIIENRLKSNNRQSAHSIFLLKAKFKNKNKYKKHQFYTPVHTQQCEKQIQAQQFIISKNRQNIIGKSFNTNSSQLVKLYQFGKQDRITGINKKRNYTKFTQELKAYTSNNKNIIDKSVHQIVKQNKQFNQKINYNQMIFGNKTNINNRQHLGTQNRQSFKTRNKPFLSQKRYHKDNHNQTKIKIKSFREFVQEFSPWAFNQQTDFHG